MVSTNITSTPGLNLPLDTSCLAVQLSGARMSAWILRTVLRGHGVVQLFSKLHPVRGHVGAREMPVGREDGVDVEGADEDSDECGE